MKLITFISILVWKKVINEIRYVVEYLLLDEVFNRIEFWMKVTETGFLGPGNMQKMYYLSKRDKHSQIINDKSCLLFYLLFILRPRGVCNCCMLTYSKILLYCLHSVTAIALYVYNNYTFTQCCCNLGTQLYFSCMPSVVLQISGSSTPSNLLMDSKK